MDFANLANLPGDLYRWFFCGTIPTNILTYDELSARGVSAVWKKLFCTIHHPPSQLSEVRDFPSLPGWVSRSMGQSAHGQVNVNPEWICRADFCKYKNINL